MSDGTDLLQQANAYYQKGDLVKAAEYYHKTIEQNPQLAEAYNNLGVIYQEQKDWQEATALHQKAIEKNPLLAEAYYNLGIAHYEQDEFQKALGHYEQTIALNPKHVGAHYNLGNLFLRLDRFDQAIAYFQKTLTFDPCFAKAHNNLGYLFKEKGDLEAAKFHYYKALELDTNDAGAHTNLGIALLMEGEYRRGFAEYEWRLAAKVLPIQQIQATRWTGQSLFGKKLFIQMEQGFGDSILFIRLLPLLKQQNCYIIFECRKPLYRLFEKVPDIDELVLSNQKSLPDFDYYIQLFSLPHRLGMTLETIPVSIPYLQANPLMLALENAEPYHLKVGVVWASRSGIGKRKSCPFTEFSRFFEIPHVLFFSLQLDLTEDEKAALAKYKNVLDCRKLIKDFADTAAILGQLDLLISVDTACAHLAGALGIPVWVLLPFVSDWRWSGQGDGSFWYPTAHLFQQTVEGGWENLIERSESALWHKMAAWANQTEIYYNWANRLKKQGRLDDALEAYDKAIALQSDFVSAWNNSAIVLHNQGRFSEAIQRYQQVLALQPDRISLYNNLGNALQSLGKFEEAVHAYGQILQRQSNDAPAHNNLGNALFHLGDVSKAIKHYKQALLFKPDYAQAYQNLGNALLKQDRIEEAIHAFQQAVRLNPEYFEAYNSWGCALKAQQRLPEAIAMFQKTLSINPDYPDAWYNWGDVLLLLGHYQEGWEKYEYRLKLADYPPLRTEKTQWRGEPIAGKTLFIYHEQGLGDSIHFIRFIPLLKQWDCHVIFECPETLLRLFRTVPGIHCLVKRGETLPEFDLFTPLMSLPHCLRTTLETIPQKTPYLTLEPNASAFIPERLKAPSSEFRLNVGIAWASHSSAWTRFRRTCPLPLFSNLFDCPEVAFWNLQFPLDRDEQKCLDEHSNVFLIGEAINDLYDMATVMTHLDLVISVDTAIAHLAGALGIPVWILIPTIPDWRWMQHRTDSPWYPKARLFRQRHLGDWRRVIKDVKQALLNTISIDSLA